MEVHRDIVERLRGDGTSWAQPMFNEAAAEIERLRAALRDVRQELWNDGDGGPRYSGYLAIVDAALEPST